MTETRSERRKDEVIRTSPAAAVQDHLDVRLEFRAGPTTASAVHAGQAIIERTGDRHAQAIRFLTTWARSEPVSVRL